MSKNNEWIRLERLADLLTVLVGLSAILLCGFLVVDRLDGRTSGPSLKREDEEVAGWRAIAQEGHRLGPADAGVVVVVFGDYECPYCRRAERALEALQEEYPADLAVVFRHFPLPSHPNAYKAAVLAECAVEQNRFESVHRSLFKAIELDNVNLEELARHTSIPDTLRYIECVRQQAGVAQIEVDIAAAKELGISGVPAFIVQGTLLGTSPDSAGLSALVLGLL